VKRLLLLTGLALLVLVLAALIAESRTKGAPKAVHAAPAPGEPLGVDTLMKQKAPPAGLLLVEGAVSTISPAEKTLLLIDSTELKACGVTTCAELTLPVRWEGKMPAVKEIVRLRGQVKSEGEKLIFVADELTAAPGGAKP